MLVASHPTYGLDVGATEYLRKQLLKQRKAGGAVLLVSEDLEEIFELCDRIAVIFQGEFMGILNSDDPQVSDIGLMMAGSLKLTSCRVSSNFERIQATSDGEGYKFLYKIKLPTG